MVERCGAFRSAPGVLFSLCLRRNVRWTSNPAATIKVTVSSGPAPPSHAKAPAKIDPTAAGPNTQTAQIGVIAAAVTIPATNFSCMTAFSAPAIRR
jgi:hypothetical protein